MVGTAVLCFVGAAWAFTSVPPEPYMDEIFHVPMTQAYCRADYARWDPKVTTPPGLYVFAVAYARGISAILHPVYTLLPGGPLADNSGPAAAAAGCNGGERDDMAGGTAWWCGQAVLRQTNWLFSLGTLWVMRTLLVRRMSPRKALAHAIFLWLYPVSFFFSFLLYTDTGGTFFLLLCYLLATKRANGNEGGRGEGRGGSWGRRVGSSIAGGISILFRQTNAVWVAFTLAICLLEDFLPLVAVASITTGATKCTPTTRARRIKVDGEGDDQNQHTKASAYHVRPAIALATPTTKTPRRRKLHDHRDHPINTTIVPSSSSTALPVPLLLWRLIRATLSDLACGAPLLRCRVPLAVPIVGFAAFVFGFNGGVVALGDKENHSPTGPPHMAQLAYLVAVCASLWGIVGSKEAVCAREGLEGFGTWARGRRGSNGVRVARVGLVVLSTAFCLWRYSLAHPFLLSDNRHYTFYVWRRLLSRPVVRSALAPVYVFCGWLVASRLSERKEPLWIVTFAGAAATVLVPSPLLEPRYLTVPVLLAHLESRERSWESLLAGVAACALVNAVTLLVFVFKPFAWHDGSVARFMW